MKKLILVLIFILSISTVWIAVSANAATRLKKPHRFGSMYKQMITDTDYLSLGNVYSDNVIIEFFDYRCRYCQKFHQQMLQALEDGKLKNIRWIVIEAPIFGDEANHVARYVLAAKEQGKYKEMFLEVAKKAPSALYEVEDIAQELGLNLEQLKMDAYTDKVMDVFKKNIKLYKKFKTASVPLIIVNKKIYNEALLDNELEEVLEEAND